MITGFGRTGKMWGVDHDGVVPDVMTVGKGIGGGFPLAAVISTDELTRRAVRESRRAAPPRTAATRSASAAGLRRSRSSRGKTWSRTPSASARAMLERLRAMQEKHRIIGDVRGKGLLLGLELVKDRAHEGARLQGLQQGPLPGVPAPGPRRDVLFPGRPHQSAAQHRRGTALDGLEILDEAIGAVAREWKLA